MLNPRIPLEPAATSAYHGPERRRRPALAWRLMTAMLDEVDYGMLLVADSGQVLHANHTALRELDGQHPLQMLGRELQARRSEHVGLLREALEAAARRGLRRLLHLGEPAQPVSVAVLPLCAPGVAEEMPATLVMLGKRQVCQDLTVQCFARSQGLTSTEAAVLGMLCAGVQPAQIAQRQGVAISTVRTQISSIRGKTGAANIRELVRRVAVLPPMVNALRATPLPALS